MSGPAARPAPAQARTWRPWVLLVLGGAAAFVVGAHLVGTPLLRAGQEPPVHPLTGRHVAGLATNAAWLDRAEREGEEEPERALDLIGVTPGLVVADVGSGSGYMTVRLASRVGPSGTVYANDIQPAMLAALRDRLRAGHITNVETVQGTEIDARLPEGAIDLVLMVDVYHEMWQPQAMLRSLGRALKADGRLVLIEYRKEDPSIPIRFDHRMSVAEARTEIGAEGFALERVIGGLPRQHILVFRPLDARAADGARR